jgi:DNA processing protein
MEACRYTFAGMRDDEILAQMVLASVPGIGPASARRLVAACGSARQVFLEKPAALKLLKAPGQKVLEARSILTSLYKQAEEELKFVYKNKVEVLLYPEPEYPSRLRHCSDAPNLLFFRGKPVLNSRYVLGVVGTRKATEYGLGLCHQIVRDLSPFDPLIVSGLAIGIDAEAHRSALHHQLNTVGVLGHGLDKMYPPNHVSLSEKMLQSGGLLTGFRSGTKPDKENFPARNRIVAGICDAVLVVEAAVTGGALITAEIALSYSRDVLVVPGRAGDKFSEGCNRLIKVNKAALVESASDIVYQLNWSRGVQKSVQASLPFDLNEQEQHLIDLLTAGALQVDELCYQMNMTPSQTNSLLLTLEFRGLIRNLPGKRYALNGVNS